MKHRLKQLKRQGRTLLHRLKENQWGHHVTEEKIELKIQGMTCDSCALHAGKALEGVTGVMNVEVPGWMLTAEGTSHKKSLLQRVRVPGRRPYRGSKMPGISRAQLQWS